MTREEAILHMVLRRAELENSVGDLEEDIKAFDMAIKALETEPCDDVISRADAQTEIMMFAGNEKNNDEIYIKVSDAIQLLRESPSVTPKQKTGYWIDHDKHIECDKCKTWFLKDHLIRKSYCPNCGAKMVDTQESEEV